MSLIMRTQSAILLLWIVMRFVIQKSTGRSVYLSEVEEDAPDTEDIIRQNIMTTMNCEEEPCEDFYKFSCGDYIVNSTRSSHKKKFLILEDLADAYKHRPDSGQKWTRLLFTFLNRCLAHQNPIRDLVGIDESALSRLSSVLGGWNMVSLGPEINQSAESLAGQIWKQMRVKVFFEDVDIDVENNQITLVAASDSIEDRKLREREMSYVFSRLKGDSLVSPDAKERFENLTLVGRRIDDLLNTSSNGQDPEIISVTDFEKFKLADFLYSAVTGSESAIFSENGKELNIKIKLIGLKVATLESIAEIIGRAGDAAVKDWMKMRTLEDLRLPTSIFRRKRKHKLSHEENCFDRAFHFMTLASIRLVVDHTMDKRGRLDLKIMSAYITQAYREYFSGMPNISDVTRLNLLNKLANLRILFGWPHWIENDKMLNSWYAGLELTDHMSLGEMKYALQQFVDAKYSEVEGRKHSIFSQMPHYRWEWYTNNAGYSKTDNLLHIFPGHMILPNYSPFYPAAINFGLVGLTIAHEIGHAFEAHGLNYDYLGRNVSLNDSDRGIVATVDQHAFSSGSKCLIRYYDQFCLQPSWCIDGTRTSLENEADVLGIKMAYRGFQLWLEKQGNRYDEFNSSSMFSDEKLFFISSARFSCRQESLEEAKEWTIKDGHTLSPFRVNGAVSQTPDFQKAFQCKTGQKMAPNERCPFWYHTKQP